MAARLCLDAGLHRLEDDSNDQYLKYKKMCFWHVYALDKGLALNLGRTSNLQDYDITTGYPENTLRPPSSPWHILNRYHVDFCRVQGQIYEKLYSARGRACDTRLKIENAKPIVAELQRQIDLLRVLH